MPTLTELRALASGPPPVPKATLTATLVTGQHVLDEERRLLDQRADLRKQLPESTLDENGQPTGPPLKAGQGGSVARELEENRAAIKANAATLAEHQGQVALTGVTGGSWQQFKNDHPPRQGNYDDVRYAEGNCDFSAVFDALGHFVTSWDGENLAPGEWDALAEQLTYASRRDMAIAVVDMHEVDLDRAPKLLSSLSSTEPSAID